MKIQISQWIYAVWSESLLSAFWRAKDAKFHLLSAFGEPRIQSFPYWAHLESQGYKVSLTERILESQGYKVSLTERIWRAKDTKFPLLSAFWRAKDTKFPLLSIFWIAKDTKFPLLSAFWIAKDAKFLHEDNEDYSVLMRRLIWIFVGSTCHKVRSLTLRFKLLYTIQLFKPYSVVS